MYSLKNSMSLLLENNLVINLVLYKKTVLQVHCVYYHVCINTTFCSARELKIKNFFFFKFRKLHIGHYHVHIITYRSINNQDA